MPSEFEQLVRQHGGRIRQIARRYAVSGAADDLVQDILVRLWRSFPGFRAEAKVETWIYRVALNAAMTHVKKTVADRGRRSALTSMSAIPDFVPPGASPAEVLSDFLRSLGDIDASIMMMYLDGLTADDMSAVLGIGANAISVRITRLKQKFSDTYVE